MQYIKEFIHTAIVHPLLMILPSRVGNELHSRSADWTWDNRYVTGEN